MHFLWEICTTDVRNLFFSTIFSGREGDRDGKRRRSQIAHRGSCRNPSRQSADGSRQGRAATVVLPLVAVLVSSPPPGRRRGVRQNDGRRNDWNPDQIMAYHFADHHFAESFPSFSPGRRKFFGKKTIPDMCSTEEGSGEDMPGSGEEEVSPGSVPPGFNPSPLLLLICGICGICDLPSSL